MSANSFNKPAKVPISTVASTIARSEIELQMVLRASPSTADYSNLLPRLPPSIKAVSLWVVLSVLSSKNRIDYALKAVMRQLPCGFALFLSLLSLPVLSARTELLSGGFYVILLF
jgi:hypothetical protein